MSEVELRNAGNVMAMTLLPAGLPQAALEAVANGVLITDAQGIILWVNAAFTRTTGYSADEVIGQTPRLLKSGEHSPDFYRELWSTISSGRSWTGDMTNRRKNGTVYVEEQTITSVLDAAGEPAYFIAVKQDRTLRRRADDALRHSEARYRLLAENISDVIGFYDLNMNTIYVSPSVHRLQGYTPDEVIARPMMDHLAAGSRELAVRVLQEELEIERSGRGDRARSRTVELEVLCKDGRTVWTESRITAVRSQAGALTGFIALSRDITERRRVEAELRDTTRTLRTIIDASVLPIVALDLDRRVMLWSNAATRLFGWSADEVLGQTLSMVPDDKRAEFEDGRARTLAGDDVIYETQRCRKDGSLVDVLRSSAPIFDSHGKLTGSMAVFVDLTERKQLEDQLRQAVKMEGI